MMRLHSKVFYIGIAFFTALLLVVGVTSHTGFQLNNIAFIFSCFIFTSLFLATSLKFKEFVQPWLLLFLVPISIFLFNIYYYHSDFVQFVLPLVVLLLIAAMVLFGLSDKGFDVFNRKWLGINIFPAMVNAASSFVNEIFSCFFPHSKYSKKYSKIAIGMVISLPVVFIFLGLFASADAVFDNLVSSSFQAELFWKKAGQVIQWVVYSGIIGTWLFLALGKYNRREDHTQEWKIDQTIVAVVLIAMNALFAVFNYVQIRFVLFRSLNQDFFEAKGITYSEYVHSGFNQLTFVCLLVFFIITGVYLLNRHKQTVYSIYLQVLLALQTVVVAFSALKRVYLYQEAYGFTVDRLYVEWFVYLMIVLFVLVAVILIARFSLTHYLWSVVMVGLVMLMLVTTVSAERIAAQKNIDRFMQTGEIDLVYLFGEYSYDEIGYYYPLRLGLSEDITKEALYLKKLLLDSTDLEHVPVIDTWMQQRKKQIMEQEEESGWRYHNRYLNDYAN